MRYPRFIMTTGATLATALVLVPAAYSAPKTPDNWAVRPAPNSMVVAHNGCQTTGNPGGAAGFDWGDAAIGAAAALGISLVGGRTATAVRGRRREVAA